MCCQIAQSQQEVKLSLQPATCDLLIKRVKTCHTNTLLAENQTIVRSCGETLQVARASEAVAAEEEGWLLKREQQQQKQYI